MVKTASRISALFLTLLCALPASAGTLTGTSVTTSYHYPNLSTSIGSVVSVVGSGVEVSCPSSAAVCGILGGTTSIDFGANTISFGQQIANASVYGSVAFHGWVFSGLQFETGITDVTLTSFGIPGLNASRLSFTSDSISLNLQGLSVAANNGWTLTLEGGPAAAVPEPGSIGLLGLGLALCGLGSIRKRPQA